MRSEPVYIKLLRWKVKTIEVTQYSYQFDKIIIEFVAYRFLIKTYLFDSNVCVGVANINFILCLKRNVHFIIICNIYILTRACLYKIKKKTNHGSRKSVNGKY